MWTLFPLIFLAGFVDAIAGGGGLISLPSYYAVGLLPHYALGCNKFSSTLGTLVASFQYARHGRINVPVAIVSGIFAIIGSALGANLALYLGSEILSVLLLILVPCIALFTLLTKDFGAATKLRFYGTKLYLISGATGLALGIYDGFFGPGTGTFYLIVFTSLFGMDAITANGTTKVVNLASNLGAVVTFMLNGAVDYSLAIPAALFGMLGGFAGSRLAIRNGVRLIKPIMLLVMCILLVKIAYDLLNGR